MQLSKKSHLTFTHGAIEYKIATELLRDIRFFGLKHLLLLLGGGRNVLHLAAKVFVLTSVRRRRLVRGTLGLRLQIFHLVPHVGNRVLAHGAPESNRNDKAPDFFYPKSRDRREILPDLVKLVFSQASQQLL